MEQKNKRKWRRKLMLVLKIILIISVLSMSIGALLHATLFRAKLSAIAPYGELVNVGDGQMHVYSLGEGIDTIVLLPGLGIPLPSADFGPLMRKLAEDYRVITIEYFGVGFSSVTDAERTSAQFVDEIRGALSALNIDTPVILMPHSISTVYAEHYATLNPEAVKAIISLDGTSTAYYAETPKILNAILPIVKFQQSLGATSILSGLVVNKSKSMAAGYTEKEINDIVTFSGFSMNDNTLEQMRTSGETIKEVMDLPFPESVAYFKIISKDTFEKPNKQLKISPQDYQFEHLKRIGDHAIYEVLEGNHFIYHYNEGRISEIVAEVLADLQETKK